MSFLPTTVYSGPGAIDPGILDGGHSATFYDLVVSNNLLVGNDILTAGFRAVGSAEADTFTSVNDITVGRNLTVTGFVAATSLSPLNGIGTTAAITGPFQNFTFTGDLGVPSLVPNAIYLASCNLVINSTIALSLASQQYSVSLFGSPTAAMSPGMTTSFPLTAVSLSGFSFTGPFQTPGVGLQQLTGIIRFTNDLPAATTIQLQLSFLRIA